MRLFLTLFLLCISSPIIHAEDALVDLSIQTNRQSYKLFEPIPIQIRVENKGTTPIQLTPKLDKWSVGRYLLIHVARKGETFQQWRSTWWPMEQSTFGAKQTLRPSESDGLALDLYWQEDLPFFDKPGTYSIKAEMYSDIREGFRLETQPLEVTVLADNTKSSDAQILQRSGLVDYLSSETADLINMKSVKWAITGKDNGGGKIIRDAMDFVKNNPSSLYSSYLCSTIIAALLYENSRLNPSLIKITKAQIVSVAPDILKHHVSPRLLFFYAMLIKKDNIALSRQYFRRAQSSTDLDPVTIELLRTTHKLYTL